MYLLDLEHYFPSCDDDWRSAYDPEIVVWGHSLEHLKNVGNQWVAECKENEGFEERRYFILVLKPSGTSEIIYRSTDE